MKPNPSLEDLHWIAGLLEGEGCFHWAKNGSPLISLAMTDLDIVEKAKKILYNNGNISRFENKDNKYKTIYRYKIYGKISIEWMKLLYPLMGVRRKEKIVEILAKWDARNPLALDKQVCKYGHDISLVESYYLQGNHKICKICNIERTKKVKFNKENDPEFHLRQAARIVARARKIPFQEALQIMKDSEKEGIQ